jgi:hypothetical protein
MVGMKETESGIQIAIVEYLTLLSHRFGFVFFSVPNEGVMFGSGKRDPATFAKASKLKRMGLTDGVSDLILCHRGKMYCIEVKTAMGRQSAGQKEFESWATASGARYSLARSVSDVQALLVEWGIMP